MTKRLFAVLRSLIIGPIFLSIWTWFLPRWVVGSAAFANPRAWGWIVTAIGAVIVIGCMFEFAWRGVGTPAPIDPPRRLVISGFYRWVRNPMYGGLGLVLVGEGVTFPRLTIMMLLVVASLWIVLSLIIIRVEEPTLRAKFGDDYAAYCRNVGRWIPRLRPFDNSQPAA
jgi:protein-S-isoprenylcysteine O-methyltransferase Ste14